MSGCCDFSFSAVQSSPRVSSREAGMCRERITPSPHSIVTSALSPEPRFDKGDASLLGAVAR